VPLPHLSKSDLRQYNNSKIKEEEESFDWLPIYEEVEIEGEGTERIDPSSL